MGASISERIPVACHGCGGKLKVGGHLAGKRVRCPRCEGAVLVPEPEPELDLALPPESGELKLELAPAAPEPERPLVLPEPTRSGPEPSRVRREATTRSAPETGLRRHAHWLLALALLPLVAFLLVGRDDLQERLERSYWANQEALDRLPEDATREQLLRALPDGRLEGALLPVDSKAHWGLALLAGVGAFGVLRAFPRGNAQVGHAVAAGVATATAGVVVLLAFQLAAELTQNVWVKGRGIGTLVFYVLKLIGFSYRAALDPDTGFVASLLGFTIGVGLCEELVKALPVILHYRRSATLDWRGAALWGLAAGLGFGIAEGVHYAGAFYNGGDTAGIYVVRFVSCVALHATWTTAVAIAIAREPTRVQEGEWWHTALGVLGVLGVAMVLHGLYDTALKRELTLLAVLAAAGSVAWLAWTIRQAEAEAQAA